MKEDNNTAGEQSNTQVQAEEQSNTFNVNEFKAIAEQNGIKVFNSDELETYTINVRNEGSKSAFNEHFGKGLESAKKSFSEKFGIEYDKDIKFKDLLNNYTPRKDQSEDLQHLQTKLQEQEKEYQKQISELQSGYQTRDMLSAFDKAFAELKSSAAIAPEHLPMWENNLKLQFQNSYSFDGQIVRQGDTELKNDLRNPLTISEVAKDFLSSSLPQKTELKSGLGISSDGSSGGSSALEALRAGDTREATRLMSGMSIEDKTALIERFKKER